MLAADRNRLRSVLEKIRDLGPTLTENDYATNVMAACERKPRPHGLPPCRFCTQGDGHWGGLHGNAPPLHNDCPAVMAWQALTGGS